MSSNGSTGAARRGAAKRRMPEGGATAAREGVTVEEVVEQAVGARVTEREGHASPRVTWPILPGGAREGVRIEDREALYDLMEGRE